MTELTKDMYIAAIDSNSRRLAEVAKQGLDAPVPSCPGWYVATLIAHMGDVQRFWALQIRERAQEMKSPPSSVYDPWPGLDEWGKNIESGGPVDMDKVPDRLVEWLELGTDELVDAFRNIEPEDKVWHWSGDNRAITHMRNQAVEATVHRIDGELAHNAVMRIDRAIAQDGIDQHFEVQVPAARSWSDAPAGRGESFHFHQTDGDGEWYVRFVDSDLNLVREHLKADVAVRGTAEDIFLWLWRRKGPDALEVIGDRAMLDRYRELAPPNT